MPAFFTYAGVTDSDHRIHQNQEFLDSGLSGARKVGVDMIWGD
uniref:Uncharacterized protein n=1 Tax=Candidatus Methanogaster sp. ANME-2c ERB4 TaxID=2759911 RepID=A0A7G9YHT7_9EURY|nr:hypothetical protein GGGHDLIA_00061 [Methanosarcinales archaeon ANME-2c ERB4]